MLMSAPIGIFTSIPAGRFVYVNRAFARMIGYESPREMIESISDIKTQIFANPEERENIIRWLDENDERLNNECCLVRRDGSQFWASYNIRAVRDGKGNIIHYEGFVFDVTEQRMEKESLLKTQFTVDMAPESILWFDEEGKVVYANNAACTSMGYTREELLEMKAFDIDPDFPPEDFERIKEEIRRAGGMKIELRHRRKDGRIFPVEVSIKDFKFGDRYMAVSFDRDISERKRVEESLRASEARMLAITESAQDAILMINPEGIISFWNPAAERILGYSRGEAIGQNLQMFLTPQNGHSLHKEAFAGFLKTGQGAAAGKTFELEARRKDGLEISIELSMSTLQLSDGWHSVGIIRDITERKRSEDALRESEEKFRILSDSTPSAVMLYQDDRFFYANKAAEIITGYSVNELLGMNFWEFIHPDYQAVAKERGRMRQQGKETITSYELKIVTKDGKENWGYLSGATTMIGGRPAGIVSVVDITDRKRAEKALRESELKYRFLTESMTDIVWTSDLNLKITYTSPSTMKVLGFTPEERRLLKAEETMTKASYEAAMDLLARELELERDKTADPDRFLLIRTEYYHKDGYTVWMESNVRFIRGPEGHPTGIHGVSRDITDRKKAEDELRDSEGVLRSLLEATPVGVILMKDRVLRKVNKTLCKITGYKEEEMIGMSTRIFYADDEEFRRIGKELYEQMELEGLGVKDAVFKRQDGELINVILSVSPFDPDDLSAGVCGIVQDITDRKRADEARKKLKEQLDHAQRLESIGTLAGGIAHDFNNLLMGIQGNAALLMLDLDPSYPHYERLKYIEEQVRSGADLTRQLLGFAQGGRYELKSTDMNEIIEKTAAMFGRTKKELTIYKKYGRDLWAVEADRSQMGQVFMNLLVNAWQAMPGGGEIVLETENLLLDDAKARPFALPAGKYIKIAISDTGTGMDAKTLERIFDPFFTTKGMGRGTGLGLATVYGIVKGHGGAINVASELGKGTTFEIYLPVTERAVVGEKAAQLEILKGTETILLVDDEAMVMDVTMRMLKSLGYRVHCAGSGQEAIAVNHEKRNEIDLVILDMIMPGISGTETFDRLREINPKQKILLSSGYSIEGMAQELLEKGCNGFLQKPFQLLDLAREVRAVLDLKEEQP